MWIQLILIGQGNGRVAGYYREVVVGGRGSYVPVATVNPIVMYLLGSSKTGSRTDLFTVQWPCTDSLRLLLLFFFRLVSLPPLNITYLLLFAAIYICCDSLVKGIFGLGNMDGIFFCCLYPPAALDQPLAWVLGI